MLPRDRFLTTALLVLATATATAACSRSHAKDPVGDDPFAAQGEAKPSFTNSAPVTYGGVEYAAIAFKAEGRERAGMHGGGYRCEAHRADEGGAQTPRMTDIHIQTPFDDCNAVLALCERL